MWILALLISVFWGSAFVTIRVGLEGYTPAQMAILRFAVAAVVLGIYGIFTGIRRPERRDLVRMALGGFFGITVYHFALNTGEQEVPAGIASILLSILPLLVNLWSYLFLKERLRVWAYIGMLVSFVGVAIISFREGQQFDINFYFWMVMLSTVAGSFFSVIQKSCLARVNPVEFNFYAICFGVIFLLPFSGGLFDSMQTAGARATLSVIYMGILPGALTFVWWGKILSTMPASRAVSFLYLIPVFATAIAWAWLGEQVSPIDMLGGAITLGGVVLANTFGKAKPAAQSATGIVTIKQL